jgi:integrase
LAQPPLYTEAMLGDILPFMAPTAIASKPELSTALLAVSGKGECTTEAYRAAVAAFLDSGAPVTVEGVAAYICALRRTRSASTVNLTLSGLLLLEALPLRVHRVTKTLYITGARVSEILGVRREQIKTSGAVELRLYGKGGKERSLRIPEEFYT